jgi:hypothetical protein
MSHHCNDAFSAVVRRFCSLCTAALSSSPCTALHAMHIAKSARVWAGVANICLTVQVQRHSHHAPLALRSCARWSVLLMACLVCRVPCSLIAS